MHKKFIHVLICIFFCTVLVQACKPSLLSEASIQITIMDGDSESKISTQPGLSVQQLLSQEHIVLGSLDRTEPPSYTVLEESSTVKIVRVTEEYSVKDIEIPFVKQTIQNESLALGESRVIQSGKNGNKQITTRTILENGVHVSESIFSETVITEAVPEIVMVGVAKPFQSILIPGSLAYIIAGNAWMMQKTTGDRKALVSTGDLDGYVFSISNDEKWLLFTRRASSSSDLNTLWIINLVEEGSKPIDLGIANIITHAAWVPGEVNTITYSTVEPTTSPPGWQSNNNLFVLSFSEGGSVWRNEKVIDTNGGGQYGWWGTFFYWSPDGNTLAYSRPDGSGYVNFHDKLLVSTNPIQALETGSDWAWVPAIGWSPDSKSIFLTTKNESIRETTTSDRFSISVISTADYSSLEILSDFGIFANPTPAPITEYGHYKIAAFKAINPSTSQASKYQLIVMDRDGSNQRILFPQTGSVGMDPRKFVWAPDRQLDQPYYLAVIYQKNLWLLDSDTGASFQVTSDGLMDAIDWK